MTCPPLVGSKLPQSVSNMPTYVPRFTIRHHNVLIIRSPDRHAAAVTSSEFKASRLRLVLGRVTAKEDRTLNLSQSAGVDFKL